MKDKFTGLTVDIFIYIAAFGIAAVPFIRIDNIFNATAVFTSVATFVIFIATVVLSDVSVYDPYWSVAPVVMLLADMIKYRLWNVNSLILLAVTVIWSLRLTANWYYTYKGIGHEDWRYASYREKCSPLVFQLLSLVGFQFFPTAVVYAGLIGAIYSISRNSFAPLSAVGIAVMLAAVLLEHVSDRSIHRFICEHGGEFRCCDASVWNYSRHPNYLGEMSFWTGMFLYFAALCPEIWYRGLGFLAIIALFLFVSIPMMEKHNSERRVDYDEYKKHVPVLLPLPKKQNL